jgi:hypothetical protein
MSARKLASVVLLVAACSGDPNEPPEATYSISILAGDGQQGPAGSVLAQPLRVTVTNSANEPVQGVVVGFDALEGDGSLLDTIGVTGLGGVASTFARLGDAAGPHRYSAFLVRATDKVTVFAASATPPAVLTSVTPGTIAAGDTIEIGGDNFAPDPGNVVLFGEIPGRVIAVEGDALIRVIVPACVAPGPVTVRVEVGSATTNTVQVTYTASMPVVSLTVGSGLVVDADELAECLLLESTGQRYLLVPQFASIGSDPVTTDFRIGRAPPPIGPLISTVGPGPAPRPMTARDRLHSLMRETEREIAPAVAMQGPEPTVTLLGTPSLNSERTFHVISDLGDPGESPEFETATARLKFIGDHILIYVDQRATASLTDADLAQVGTLFDNRLYDIAVSTFGSESDLDANGKVIVLMSPSVNGLVPASECSTGFIAGYFYPNDLFLRNQNSNKGEIFYTLAPDPTGAFGCAHTVPFVKRFIPTTFIHELQHMISFNQHVLTRAGTTEAVWLNEGLSLIAEETAGRFYENRDTPPPGQPYSDSASMFLTDILVNAYDYLFASRSNSITTFASFGTLEERGAAWLFLRWLGTQKGSSIYGRLVQTRSTSIENVEEQAGETFGALFGDFGIASAADVPPVIVRTSLSPRYRFDRDFRVLFAFIQDRFDKPTPSPITYGSSEIQADGTLSQRSMVQGTMTFFSFRTTGVAETTTGLRFTTPTSTPFDPTLRAQLGIVRVQ